MRFARFFLWGTRPPRPHAATRLYGLRFRFVFLCFLRQFFFALRAFSCAPRAICATIVYHLSPHKETPHYAQIPLPSHLHHRRCRSISDQLPIEIVDRIDTRRGDRSQCSPSRRPRARPRCAIRRFRHTIARRMAALWRYRPEGL